MDVEVFSSIASRNLSSTIGTFLRGEQTERNITVVFDRKDRANFLICIYKLQPTGAHNILTRLTLSREDSCACRSVKI